MKITYREFQRFMKKDGYADQEIRHLFNTIKKMDKESRRWVIRWFHEGEFPKNEIEGVTAEFLMKELGYKPINAFIALNWLKEDPESAKYFMVKKPAGEDPGKSVGAEMEVFLKKMGREVTPVMDLENTDDVVEAE